MRHTLVINKPYYLLKIRQCMPVEKQLYTLKVDITIAEHPVRKKDMTSQRQHNQPVHNFLILFLVLPVALAQVQRSR